MNLTLRKVFVSALVLLPVASIAKGSRRRACAIQCGDHCKSRQDANRCARNFIANRCLPRFSGSVFNRVKTDCLHAAACLDKGKKICDDLSCIRRRQCCNAADCSAQDRCMNYWCAPKGSPSFTLTWDGVDDLDLHVKTPGGVELSYANTYDPVSGGTFQHDDIPRRSSAHWQETVHFPLNGAAPKGNYEYWAFNNHDDFDRAERFRFYVFDGDRPKISGIRGAVENGEDSKHFFFTYE